VSDDVLDDQGVDHRDLDELADKLRVATVRLRLQRLAIGPVEQVIEWPMLKRSEQDQWRDIARAAQAVMP
jgi:hypothetical protein